MSSPRLRRISADYQAIRAEFSGHPYVTVQPVGPPPPEVYRIEFRLKGLVLQGQQPVVSERHLVELVLPLSYPREQPLIRPLTPVFHPNVNDDHYCLTDYWSAGETLADIVAKIGDIIQWRTYNVHSPLNATAALWARESERYLPIGNVELRQAEVEIKLIDGGAASQSPQLGLAGGADKPQTVSQLPAAETPATDGSTT